MITFQNEGHLFKTNCVSQFSNIELRFLDNQNRQILFKSDNRIALTFIKETFNDKSEKMLEVLEKLEGMTQLQILGEYLQINRNA